MLHGARPRLAGPGLRGPSDVDPDGKPGLNGQADQGVQAELVDLSTQEIAAELG
jgi:hypothetical protein